METEARVYHISAECFWNLKKRQRQIFTPDPYPFLYFSIKDEWFKHLCGYVLSKHIWNKIINHNTIEEKCWGELRTRCEPFFFKLFWGEQLSYFKGISGSEEIMGKNSLSFDCVPLFFFLKCLLKVYTFLKMSFKKFKLHNVITFFSLSRGLQVCASVPPPVGAQSLCYYHSTRKLFLLLNKHFAFLFVFFEKCPLG